MSQLEEQVRREQEEHEREQAAASANGAGDDGEKDDKEPEEVLPMQVPLEGLSDGITMSPGGTRATTASVTLRGGKLNVSGEFKKGDVVNLYVRVKIAEVHFVDSHDGYGTVTGTERQHVAKPIAVQRLDPEEPEA